MRHGRRRAKPLDDRRRHSPVEPGGCWHTGQPHRSEARPYSLFGRGAAGVASPTKIDVRPVTRSLQSKLRRGNCKAGGVALMRKMRPNGISRPPGAHSRQARSSEADNRLGCRVAGCPLTGLAVREHTRETCSAAASAPTMIAPPLSMMKWRGGLGRLSATAGTARTLRELGTGPSGIMPTCCSAC